MRTSLLTSLLLLTTACGGSGYSYDPENPVSLTPIMKEGFEYITGGHGFDGDDNLVLLGRMPGTPSDAPGETLRWNRERKEFERFGGPLPVTDGFMVRDGKGRLYLRSGFKLFTWAKGDAAWAEVALPPGFEDSGSQRRYVLEEVVGDRAGTLFARFTYHDSGGQTGTGASKGLALFRRAPGEAQLAPFLELPQDSQGFVPHDGQRLTGFAIHARGDGTLLVESVQALFAVPPGGRDLVRVFDCGAVVGKHCTGGGPVFTHPLSDDAYLPGYRIPRGTAFPVVPQAIDTVPMVGRSTRFRVDADGTFWSYFTEEGAMTVDYPPYLLDVTTVRKLEGTTWEPVVALQTPGFSWTHSDHGAFYSFGRQLISGGIWTSWGVYALEP